MNIKITSFVFAVALSSDANKNTPFAAAAGNAATLRGLGQGHGGRGGQGGSQGRNHNNGGPQGGGGRGRGGPGGEFPWTDIDIETVTIPCDGTFDCTLRNGEAGVLVCRERHHPMTGEIDAQDLCIPSDQAWTTDQCGCCGEEACPEQPEYMDLGCDSNADELFENFSSDITPRSFNNNNNNNGAGVSVVCRNLTNPFTGETAPTTIPIHPAMGLEDDICGCCDGNCPEEGGLKNIFERPMHVNKTCDAVDETLITCTVPRRRGRGHGRGRSDSDEESDLVLESDSDEEEEEVEGIFVCRQRFDPLTGDSKSEAMCISPDRAWDTDTCGCCGEDCPTRPEPVDVDCSALAEEPVCDLRHGEEGVFACRSHYHPVTGDIEQTSLCVRRDHSWPSDVCGCCASGCPETPSGGFDDEDAQMVTAAALAAEEGDSSGSEVLVVYLSAVFALVATATAIFV